MSQRKGFVYILYAFIGASCLLTACLLLLISTSEAALATGSVVQPDAPGSISGHVKNLKGDSLEGIQVFLFSSNTYIDVKTDQSGFYRFPIVAADEYVVGFGSSYEANQYLTEYYSDSVTFEGATKILVAGNQVENIDATLTKASKITGTISFANASITETTFLAAYAFKFDAQSSTWTYAASVSVDSGRNYVIGGLAAGTYRVCVSAYATKSPSSLLSCYGDAIYVTGAKDIVVGAEEIVPDINIVFRDNPDYATISGRVLDLSGNPISGITIYINPTAYLDPSPGNSIVTTTDQNGDYTLSTLTPNVFSYTVIFSDPNGNYLPEYYNNATNSESAKTFRPQPRQVISNVNAVLEYAGHISGTITLQKSTPFVRGFVTLYRYVGNEWQTYLRNNIDETSGNYHFSGLSTGAYRVCADFYSGYQAILGCYGSKTVISATDVNLITGQVRSNVNFDVSTKLYEGSIAGQVNTNGTPLSGMGVELINSANYGNGCDDISTAQGFLPTDDPRLDPDLSDIATIYTSTDGQGNYKFKGLMPGYYIVKASDPQLHYGTSFYNETSNAPALTGINLDCGQVREGVNISMTVAGAVSGRITIASGEPLSNTEITLSWPSWYDQSTNQVTVTNQEGNYLIRGVQPGTYSLMALSTVNIYPYESPIGEFYGFSDGVYTTPKPITVTSGLTTTGIDIILGPDGILWLPQVRMNN